MSGALSLSYSRPAQMLCNVTQACLALSRKALRRMRDGVQRKAPIRYVDRKILRGDPAQYGLHPILPGCLGCTLRTYARNVEKRRS